MAGSIVAWDVVDFLTYYPRFGVCGASTFVEPETLAAYFEVACSYVDNTADSLIPYDPESGVFIRKILLYAIICHIATLEQWSANGQSGPLASANEGSVSVSFQSAQYKQGSDLAAWLRQTSCGQNAWVLLSRYVSGGRLYRVKHCHPFG